MLMFWFVIVLMLLLAAGFILPALLGKTYLRNADRNELNIAIAKERLLELEQEFNNGLIDEELYQQQKTECQKSLVTDVTESGIALDDKTASKTQIILALIIIPLITIPMYFSLGTPSVFDDPNNPGSASADSHEKQGMVSMEEALNNLARRLEQDPTNIKGWQMLARSYMSVKRYDMAADSYGKLYQLVGDKPAVMLAYADALSMSRGGKITGQPFALIKKALQLSPDSITALWLTGLGYSEAGQYDTAIQYWQQLVPLLQADEASRNQVLSLITQAEQKLGHAANVNNAVSKEVGTDPVNGAASIIVTVSLAEKFQSMVSPDDVVFIFAKASQGPPMPLAAVRKRISDLPITVTLDDSMAMMPQMKLSSFAEVSVGARISKSGSAIGQSGDLEGVTGLVSVSTGTKIKVLINTIK
ncbi:MAG: c-type cytochrome biogenesis protein CcmI [Gammaproteobacteria bacterium]|nr:c-type cytochrome biogenesis protein CcmI [Gammaproteobacteria bacterium]